jgi:hypothetical protein
MPEGSIVRQPASTTGAAVVVVTTADVGTSVGDGVLEVAWDVGAGVVAGRTVTPTDDDVQPANVRVARMTRNGRRRCISAPFAHREVDHGGGVPHQWHSS